ncbi:hypothetical protein V6N12_058992 [Hibiscus sabdariffa]|uniref:Uncharacterized protein n=1 Tax=Hibiscus sabdariffa TaxID=183260 RepID=A0ABR2EUB6_9ROSI
MSYVSFNSQEIPSLVLSWAPSSAMACANNLWDLCRRSPISIAVIYIITQLSDDKKPLRDISLATGVAEGISCELEET